MEHPFNPKSFSIMRKAAAPTPLFNPKSFSRTFARNKKSSTTSTSCVHAHYCVSGFQIPPIRNKFATSKQRDSHKRSLSARRIHCKDSNGDVLWWVMFCRFSYLEGFLHLTSFSHLLHIIAPVLTTCTQSADWSHLWVICVGVPPLLLLLLLLHSL